MKAQITKDYSWPSILLVGDKVRGRRPTAMLMGACFWTIDHLEKALPLYEEQFNEFYRRQKAEYTRLHRWVAKSFPTPAECEHCGVQDAKQYDWASIEDRYTRERDDWEYLCRSCHVKSDGRSLPIANYKGPNGMEGKSHSEETRAKMRANHWSTRKKWQGRERDEHGRFI